MIGYHYCKIYKRRFDACFVAVVARLGLGIARSRWWENEQKGELECGASNFTFARFGHVLLFYLKKNNTMSTGEREAHQILV
jgi:hypothetical protein